MAAAKGRVTWQQARLGSSTASRASFGRSDAQGTKRRENTPCRIVKAAARKKNISNENKAKMEVVEVVEEVVAAPPGSETMPPELSMVASEVAPPPLAPAPRSSSGGGTPAFVWFGVGIGVTILLQKVITFFTKGGLQRMLMQQMMKNMGGGGMPGGMPGAMGGGMPGGTPPPNPFAGFTPPQPGASPSPTTSPFGMGATPTTATNTTATNTTATTTTTAKPASTPDKVSSKPKEKTTTSTGATTTTDEKKASSEVSNATTGSSSSSSSSGGASSSSFFQDVDESTKEASTFEPKPVEEVEEPPSIDPEVMGGAGAGAGAGAGGAAGAGGGGMMDMVEQMMKDPKMQEMMYPYLPEGMRNPETFNWILSNPEMRSQMENMLKEGGMPNMPGGMPGSGMPGAGMNPEMMNNMMNMQSDDFKKQFDQVGMSPDEVLKKILADPELASAFQNPRVQQAMMDCSANPANISKYTGDQEVMDAMIKMSQLFPGATQPPSM